MRLKKLNLSNIKPFYPYLWHYKRSIFYALLCGVVGGATSVIITYLIGVSVDQIHGFHQVNFQRLWPIIGWLLLLIVINALTIWAINVFANHVGYYAVRDLRNDLYAHINELPVRFFDEHSHGDLLSRFTNDLDYVSDAIVAIFNTLFSGLTIILMSLVFMLYLSPLLTIVVALATVIMFFTTSGVAWASQRYFGKQQKLLGDVSGYVTEHVSNQALIDAFNRQQTTEDEFNVINQAYNKWGQKAQFVSSLANPTTRFADHLGYLSIGTTGGVLMLLGVPGISVGLISSFIIYAEQFTTPFQNLSGFTTQIQTAISGLQRVLLILQAKPESGDVELPEVTHAPKQFEFEHVDFSYEPDQSLIKDLNLTVNEGEMVAIVGQTGAGKTTLVNLMMRFYDVTGGAIKIDHQNIQGFTRDSYRHQFGMVLQETWLFHGTVRDNLCLGVDNATDAQLDAVMAATHLTYFIQNLPKGYDTVIGGDDTEISSGQQQLLTIARVMLLNPPVLVLDEATSELDTLTEAQVQEALDQLMKGKTSFIIAHRLSTIKRASTIIVMDQGNIVEMGTHDELLQKKGAYYRLYEAQFAGKSI